MSEPADVIREAMLPWGSTPEQAEAGLAALTELEEQLAAAESDADKLHGVLAKVRTERDDLRERCERYEKVVEVMHRTYHTGVASCPCLAALSPASTESEQRPIDYAAARYLDDETEGR